MPERDEKLKPCPFCGSEKIKIEYPSKRTIQIKCPNCVICYRQKYLRLTEEELLEKMIEQWNTRQSPTLNEEKVREVLEKKGHPEWIVLLIIKALKSKEKEIIE